MTAYFDHNATTPVHPEVFQAMSPFLQDAFGNASCLYRLGVDASYAVEKARIQTARLLNAQAEEIVFTSGGTESDNLAIKGALFATGKNHVITSAIEHPAVLRTCEFVEKYMNAHVTRLPVDSEGRVSPEDVERAITPDTALITIMAANNEIGTIQPFREIAGIAKRHSVLFHTDAVQAVGRIPLDMQNLEIDLLSLSAHKFYGPKGVGALYVRKGVEIVPLLHGGTHEGGFRAGTENVSAIAGLGKAADLARKEMTQRCEHVSNLAALLWDLLSQSGLNMIRNSPADGCLPGTLNFTLPGLNARELVRALDEQGYAIATGSACSTGKPTPSYVIQALGRRDEEAKSSIRISLGISNTEEQVRGFVEAIPGVVRKIQ